MLISKDGMVKVEGDYEEIRSDFCLLAHVFYHKVLKSHLTEDEAKDAISMMIAEACIYSDEQIREHNRFGGTTY